MQTKDSGEASTPTQRIDAYIAGITDWRGSLLTHLRTLILDSAPELSEEWKWETPVFAHKGNVLALGVFKDHVKLNFFKGAALADPDGLFNAGLEAKATRSIDLHEGDVINETALRGLIRSAVERNQSQKK
ncbi:MAG: DUF1801 domain-containing protein [Caldilineaceae bacterium]